MKAIIKYLIGIKIVSVTKLIRLLTGVIILLTLGCDDIFEIDIDNQKVILVAPGDGVITEYSTQTFYWEELKGALKYNLMIVTPSFDHIEQIVADTNVSVHKFTLDLGIGNYEWRVIAKNGSSKTSSYTIWKLQVDSTLDLSKSNVTLLSPANGVASKGENLNFQWKKIPNATEYEFQMGRGGLQDIIIDSVVTDFNLVFNDSLTDGNYTWGVKAKNNNTSTVLSSRTILIDATKPVNPILTEPTDRKLLTDKKVKLLWSRALTDGGSKLSDYIYVSIDSLSLVQLDLRKTEKFEVDTLGLYHTFAIDTSYYWMVTTFDAAGNQSVPSAIRNFKIKTL